VDIFSPLMHALVGKLLALLLDQQNLLDQHNQHLQNRLLKKKLLNHLLKQPNQLNHLLLHHLVLKLAALASAFAVG
jgi:hypothetical protein